MSGKERNFQFNEMIVTLFNNMTIYAVMKALECKRCGYIPDKRNLKRLFNKYKDKYTK